MALQQIKLGGGGTVTPYHFAALSSGYAGSNPTEKKDIRSPRSLIANINGSGHLYFISIPSNCYVNIEIDDELVLNTWTTSVCQILDIMSPLNTMTTLKLDGSELESISLVHEKGYANSYDKLAYFIYSMNTTTEIISNYMDNKISRELDYNTSDVVAVGDFYFKNNLKIYIAKCSTMGTIYSPVSGTVALEG